MSNFGFFHFSKASAFSTLSSSNSSSSNSLLLSSASHFSSSSSTLPLPTFSSASGANVSLFSSSSSFLPGSVDWSTLVDYSDREVSSEYNYFMQNSHIPNLSDLCALSKSLLNKQNELFTNFPAFGGIINSNSNLVSSNAKKSHPPYFIPSDQSILYSVGRHKKKELLKLYKLYRMHYLNGLFDTNVQYESNQFYLSGMEDLKGEGGEDLHDISVELFDPFNSNVIEVSRNDLYVHCMTTPNLDIWDALQHRHNNLLSSAIEEAIADTFKLAACHYVDFDISFWEEERKKNLKSLEKMNSINLFRDGLSAVEESVGGNMSNNRVHHSSLEQQEAGAAKIKYGAVNEENSSFPLLAAPSDNYYVQEEQYGILTSDKAKNEDTEMLEVSEQDLSNTERDVLRFIMNLNEESEAQVIPHDLLLRLIEETKQHLSRNAHKATAAALQTYSFQANELLDVCTQVLCVAKYLGNGKNDTNLVVLNSLIMLENFYIKQNIQLVRHMYDRRCINKIWTYEDIDGDELKGINLLQDLGSIYFSDGGVGSTEYFWFMAFCAFHMGDIRSLIELSNSENPKVSKLKIEMPSEFFLICRLLASRIYRTTKSVLSVHTPAMSRFSSLFPSSFSSASFNSFAARKKEENFLYISQLADCVYNESEYSLHISNLQLKYTKTNKKMNPHLTVLLSLIALNLVPPCNFAQTISGCTQEDYLWYKLHMILLINEETDENENVITNNLQELAHKIKSLGESYFMDTSLPNEEVEMIGGANLVRQESSMTYIRMLSYTGFVLDSLLLLTQKFPYFRRIGLLMGIYIYKTRTLNNRTILNELISFKNLNFLQDFIPHLFKFSFAHANSHAFIFYLQVLDLRERLRVIKLLVEGREVDLNTDEMLGYVDRAGNVVYGKFYRLLCLKTPHKSLGSDMRLSSKISNSECVTPDLIQCFNGYDSASFHAEDAKSLNERGLLDSQNNNNFNIFKSLCEDLGMAACRDGNLEIALKCFYIAQNFYRCIDVLEEAFNKCCLDFHRKVTSTERQKNQVFINYYLLLAHNKLLFDNEKLLRLKYAFHKVVLFQKIYNGLFVDAIRFIKDKKLLPFTYERSNMFLKKNELKNDLLNILRGYVFCLVEAVKKDMIKAEELDVDELRVLLSLTDRFDSVDFHFLRSVREQIKQLIYLF